MAEVSVVGDNLVIKIQGLRKLWTLTNELSIPLSDVRGVAADPAVGADFPRALQKRLGTNLWHTYYGGSFVQDGDRVFWDVHDPAKAVVILLANEEFQRLVLEVQDPDAVVRDIEAALARRAGD